MTIGICKLCQKEKELIGRSHIWPKFMYKGMHDDKGRLFVINSEKPHNHKKVQSGAYEQYIFCSDCDNRILGQLERYASNNLFEKKYFENNDDFQQISIPSGGAVIHCRKLDYVKFKLFLLSLLWRASVSTEPLFENFKLSAEQEEFLRESIYEHTVVDESVFPCVLLTSPIVSLDENFIAIDPLKAGIVKFYINAFVYTFYLTENKMDQTTMELAIGMDNGMGIINVSSGQWNQIRMTIINATVSASQKNL